MATVRCRLGIVYVIVVQVLLLQLLAGNPAQAAPGVLGDSGNGSASNISASSLKALIPQADVEANIAKIEENADPNCPSLENANNLSQTNLIKRLTHNCRYDRHERPTTFGPNGERRPLYVYVRAYVYFMQNPEAYDLQFKIHALIQMRYVDPRLVFKRVAPQRTDQILGEQSLRSALWVPHIFLANERSSSILGTADKDVLTSISPDGTVIISTRVQATLHCWMNLQKFPFDQQTCSTVYESWMYNTSELQLHWEPRSPVTFTPELRLTEYVIMKRWTNESTVNADIQDLRHGAFVGNYSSLSFSVHLARDLGYYIMDYYVPSIMLVAISWVSFWLQADQAPPRVVLGITTMLTFITLASAQGKTLPKVSYIKFSEVWFLGCTGFIFASLVEFAFVNTIWRRKHNIALKKVNSKYILKSTLTPRPIRRDIGAGKLHKSSSLSSLDVPTVGNGAAQGFNNYLTVHGSCPSQSLPSNTTTQSIGNESTNGIRSPVFNGNSTETLSLRSGEPWSVGASGTNGRTGWTTMTPHEISEWIDRRSRMLFPCAFAVFNAFYWTLVYCL